ncbi:MAG: glycosyltransferase family 4 protein [Candidatus Gracilibacteria bacterium]|nr:glycosyltransferase family 4 protein [Candidatus Gracilibacteria bacterium]
MKYQEIAGLIGALDLGQQDLEANFETLKKWEGKQFEIKTINWFVPRFEHALYGGIYTIFRFADYFRRQGILNRIVIYDNPFGSQQEIKTAIAKGFPELAEQSEIIIFKGDIFHPELPECDISIATFWTSAFISARFNKTKRKYYFIQDYEPLFYSANTLSAMCEMTYRLGFKGIFNTPGLEKLVKEKWGLEGISFTPCIDREVYNIPQADLAKKLKRAKVKIVTYGRPKHERNAFELSIAALKQVEAKYGDRVEIVSVGAEWQESDFGVEGIVKNLGRLESLQEVADLYRDCDIGLVFMFTPHPSYQPFEYMACGSSVVTNYNPANLWLFQDGVNAILVEPTVGLVADGISKLIDNPELRAELIKNGQKTIVQHDWETECGKVWQYLNRAAGEEKIFYWWVLI